MSRFAAGSSRFGLHKTPIFPPDPSHFARLSRQSASSTRPALAMFLGRSSIAHANRQDSVNAREMLRNPKIPFFLRSLSPATQSPKVSSEGVAR